MNTSFDITDIDCAPKELEDALGVSGRTLFDPTEHPIHVDIWDGKAYVTLAEMIELEGDAVGINRVVMNRYMRNQREWPIRVLDKIAPALKWQDGLDIFIAANSEEKEPQSTTSTKSNHRQPALADA